MTQPQPKEQPCRLDWRGLKHVPCSYTNELGTVLESAPLCDQWTTR